MSWGKQLKPPSVSVSTGVVEHCLSHDLRTAQTMQEELCPGSMKLSVKTS